MDTTEFPIEDIVITHYKRPKRITVIQFQSHMGRGQTL